MVTGCPEMTTNSGLFCLKNWHGYISLVLKTVLGHQRHVFYFQFYEILVAARLGMCLIIDLVRILRELASKKFLC